MKPKVTRLEQIRNDLDKYIKEELEKSPGHRDWEVFSFLATHVRMRHFSGSFSYWLVISQSENRFENV